MSKWRKVEEELPPKMPGSDYSDWCAVWVAAGYWTRAVYDLESEVWGTEAGYEIDVTHWQPIEPPEE